MEDGEWLRELDSTEATGAAFDVCDAFAVFWAGWHGGQHTRLYSLGSRFAHAFDYRPAAGLGEESLEGNARDFYACLCVAFNVDDPIRKEIFGTA
jgi:hypothetical protein